MLPRMTFVCDGAVMLIVMSFRVPRRWVLRRCGEGDICGSLCICYRRGHSFLPSSLHVDVQVCSAHNTLPLLEPSCYPELSTPPPRPLSHQYSDVLYNSARAHESTLLGRPGRQASRRPRFRFRGAWHPRRGWLRLGAVRVR